METRIGRREKPIAISVSSGLYHSMRPSAPTKETLTVIMFCSFPTKSVSIAFTSLESAEMYSDVFSPEKAWMPFSISRSKA